MSTESGSGQDAAARKTQRLAKLFDLRTFIGALFLIFGVVVSIEGATASAADIAKAAGVNLSLWTGLAMLVVGIAFIGWMLAKPPEVETRHQDLSRPPDAGH
jgi:xanthine/uracil/vitamin C permease (AzgA family)